MAEENDQDQDDKTEDPSSHRIEEFRKRGDVASSKELTSVLVLFACILSLAMSLVYIFEVLSGYLEWLYAMPTATAFSEESIRTITSRTAETALKCAAPVLVTAFLVGIFSNIIQVGILFSPDVLELNWDRVNPILGFQKLFSFRAFLEAIKGLFKFVIIGLITYSFMQTRLQSWGGFLHLSMAQSFLQGKELLVALGSYVVMGLVLVAIGDFIYQKLAYRKKLMLSKEQAKREHKEHEGNPEIKQRIKTIQRQIMQKRMFAEVPKGDVVVTNPTHLSVVLKYDKDTMVSPTVIAKGADHVALRIRELAKESNIPIVENVPLARSLYKTVKVGAPVPRDLYKAVAGVLAFVYKLKRKENAVSMRANV